MPNNTDLADRDLRVLELTEQYPRPTVTTLREVLYWAEKNQHVHYRLDKLEERGLVTTWKDEDTETRGPLDPRRANTTEAGEALLDDVERESEYSSVEERLDEVERKVENALEQFGLAKRRIVDAEEKLEEVDSDVSDVREDLGRVKELMKDGPMTATVDEFDFGNGD